LKNCLYCAVLIASTAMSKCQVWPMSFFSDVLHWSQWFPPLRLDAAGHSSIILKVSALALSASPEDEMGVIW